MRRAAVVAAVGALGALAAGAGGDDQTQFSLDVNRVEITFSVTDRRGHFAALTRDDFAVYDDKQPQKIVEFTAESELPLRLALLVDTSNSVRERFHFIQEAAASFLVRSLRPGTDQAMLVSFDASPEVAAEFSGDPKQLTGKIQDLRPGGGTSLYDAISFAARRLAAEERTGARFRAAIVIFSDGEDTQSNLTRDQALEAAQRANAVLYAVSTGGGEVSVMGDKVLKYLTSETGGTALFPFRLDDLARSFDSITQELRHQYNILYKPEPFRSDGKFHAVEIRLKQQKGFILRARKGYYAPSPPKAATK
jgi:Ca-activated chloride channel family protein